MRALLLSAALAAVPQPGWKVPADLSLHDAYTWPPEKVNLAERVAGKKVPGYLEAQEKLKKMGIDEVLVFCVNDAAVMRAWAADQGVTDGKLKDGSKSIVNFLADPYGAVPHLMDLGLNHPGPHGKGIIGRSKRFAMYLEDGVMKSINVSEKPDDPAGDDFPESSCAPAMMDTILAISKKGEL